MMSLYFRSQGPLFLPSERGEQHAYPLLGQKLIPALTNQITQKHHCFLQLARPGAELQPNHSAGMPLTGTPRTWLGRIRVWTETTRDSDIAWEQQMYFQITPMTRMYSFLQN